MFYKKHWINHEKERISVRWSSGRKIRTEIRNFILLWAGATPLWDHYVIKFLALGGKGNVYRIHGDVELIYEMRMVDRVVEGPVLFCPVLASLQKHHNEVDVRCKRPGKRTVISFVQSYHLETSYQRRVDLIVRVDFVYSCSSIPVGPLSRSVIDTFYDENAGAAKAVRFFSSGALHQFLAMSNCQGAVFFFLEKTRGKYLA
jgi:hypothetical protein